MNEVKLVFEAPRGCGTRKKGGCYLRSEGSPDGILPLFTVLDPPIPMTRQLFRGYILVSGDAILARLPESEWLEGVSKENYEKDQWDIVHFGSSWNKRKTWGICKDIEDTWEGLAALMGAVRYADLSSTIRELTLLGASTLAPLGFSRFVQNYHSVKEGSFSASKLVQAYAGALYMLHEARSCKPQIKTKVLQIAFALHIEQDVKGIATS